MLTPYLIDRAFYRLENNLIDNDEVRSYYAPKFEAATKSLPDYLELLSAYISLYGNRLLPFALLEGAKPLPADPFIERFYSRNNMAPYPLGFIFEKRDWKKFKKFMAIEKWAAGIYYGKSLFNGFSLVPELSSMGMIFMGNYSEKENLGILEHECLHSCLNKHSAGLSLINDLHYSPDLEFHHLAYIMESRMMNELIAYQDSFGVFIYYWDVKGTLKGNYVDRQIKYIEGMYGENTTLPVRLKHYMRERISKEAKYFKTIVKSLPRHIRTPLLFGMGPTKEEVEKESLKSSLDDIIIWSFLVQKPEYMEKAKSILKAKGYSLD